MAASAGRRHPSCKVLNFFTDDSDGCALTVLVNGVRFHVISDLAKLTSQSTSNHKIVNEYKKLMRAVRQQKAEEGGTNKDIDSQDSGYSDSVKSVSINDEKEETDSAIDITESSRLENEQSSRPQRDTVTFTATSERNDEKALQDWILAPFGPIFDDLAPPSSAPEQKTVQSWYDAPTHFFELEMSDGTLETTRLESTNELQQRMSAMVPKMPIPKYLRSKDIPWYKAKDVVVLSESNDPEPWHPARVEVDGSSYFLKVVDFTQPQPTKRELKVLKRLEDEGITDQIRVPKIEGFTGFGDSHVEIMGFLQTEIKDPTPLTKLLDEGVPQKKRQKWAEEADRVKKVLHENGVVWGDAKADNFMVDKDDQLWIIDFGGSYTEGWVDPEIMETEAGDDMGVEKIVNALEDPVGNTWDPNLQDMQATASGSSNNKRVAEEWDASDSDHAAKRRRRGAMNKTVTFSSSTKLEDGGRDLEASDGGNACICDDKGRGTMIGCDNKDCERQWFHLSCLGLKTAPKSKEWFCKDCKDDS